MADSILNDPNVLAVKKPDQQPVDNTAELERLRIEQARIQQEQTKQREAIQPVVDEVRRKEYELRVGRESQATGQMEVFLQESARNREIMQGRTSTAPLTFDIKTRRFTNAPQVDRTADTALRVAQVKTDLGLTALGAKAPPTGQVKPMTGQDIFDTNRVSLSDAEKNTLANSIGGRFALNEYNQRLSTVMNDVQSALPSLVEKDGSLDKAKVADYIAKNPQFIPSMAGDVRDIVFGRSVDGKTIGGLVGQHNQMNDDARRIKSVATAAEEEAKLRAMQVDKTEIEGISSGPRARAIEAIKSNEYQKIAPELGRLGEGSATHSGMTPAEQTLYLADKVSNDADIKQERLATQYLYARPVFGRDAVFDGGISTPVAEQTARLNEAFGEIDSLYISAILNGSSDPITYIMDNLVGKEAISGMDEKEAFEFIGQVYDEVNERVMGKINQRANEIRQEQIEGLVTSIASSYGSEYVKSQSAEYFKGITDSETFANQREDDRIQSLKSFIIDRASAEQQKGFAGYSPEEYSDALTLQGGYKNALLGLAPEPVNDDQYDQIKDMVGAMVMEGMATAKRDELNISAQLIDAKNKIDRFGLKATIDGKEVDTHIPLPVGGKVYVTPAMVAGNQNTVALLSRYKDNEYVANLFANASDTNGIIRDGTALQNSLNAIVIPPTKELKELYTGEKMKGVLKGVEDRYARLPEGSMERSILESATITDAITGEPDAPLVQSEWDKIAPAIEYGSSNEKWYSNDQKEVTSVEMLNKASEMIGVPEISGVLRDQTLADPVNAIVMKDGMLRDMYMNGDSTAKARAITIGYMRQREQVQKNALTNVVGGRDKDGVEYKGMLQNLETIYEQDPFVDNRGNLSSVKLGLNEWKAQGSTFVNALTARDEIEAWAAKVNIEQLRDRVTDYEKNNNLAGELYGSRYSEPSGYDQGVVKAKTEVATNGIEGTPSERIDLIYKQAKDLLSSYDSAHSSIMNTIRGATSITPTAETIQSIRGQ